MRILKRNILLGIILLGTIASARADIFRGQVVDAQNRPIANAELLIQSSAAKTQKDFYRTQRADARGKFSVDLQPGYGNYYGRLTAAAPGMAAASISLNAAAKDKNNSIQLQPAQTVSGRVVDENGKPVARVKVQLRGYSVKSTFPTTFFIESPWQNRYQTFTDKNGRWQMKTVPANANVYMIVADPRFVSQMFNASPGAPSVTNVRPGATLRGRVVNQAEKPVANIEVTAQGQGNNEGWGRATTTADGSYQLTGLSNGLYNIMVFMDDKSQVAKAIEGQAAHEGQSEKLRDLVLTPGAFISGQALNIKTGKPVPGIMIGGYGPQNPKTSAAAISDTTDANGHYTLRVVPGKNYVYLMGAFGFIQNTNDGKNVTVEAGKTATQNFELDPGESVSGIVVDRNDKPLAGVYVTIAPMQTSNVYIPSSTSVASDAGGHWKVQALAPTTTPMKVDVSAPWVMMQSVQITVPDQNEIKLKVEKITDLPPAGRIVDINNKPLADIETQLLFFLKPNESDDLPLQDAYATSDQNGYLHFKLPPDIDKVTVTNVAKPGYVFARGGQWNAKTQTLSDVVLDQLTNSVRGKLFNQNGKPVSGVKIQAAGIQNAVTTSNKNGEFSLSNLPHQQITLLASAGNLVAKSTSKSSAPIILRLAPLPSNHFPTRAQSLDMLEKIYHETANSTFYARSTIAYEIAKYDLQRGLNLLKDKTGNIPASQFYPVLYLLKEKDPARALKWGQDHLAKITEDDDRVQILCELAKLAEPKNDALAQKYFSQAVAIAQTFPAPQQKTYGSDEPTTTPMGKFLLSRAELAGAAAVVRPQETHQWVAEIFPYSVDQNRGTRGDYDWARDLMAQSLGANAPEETAALVEHSAGRAKSTELKSAVQAAVDAKNILLAQRWLDQLQQLYQEHKAENPQWAGLYDFGQATRSVIELAGPKNPTRALQLARSIDDKKETMQSLMVAAVYQPKQLELATLKEAFEMQSLVGGGNLARMAGLIYDIDPAQGKVLFDRLLKRYQSQQQDDNIYSSGRISGVELAYFLARYQPTASWEILQNERVKSQLRSDKWSVDWGTALAMSALNFDEAMKWAQQVTPRDGFNYDAQRKLLQIALATPEVRRTLRLDRLGASDTWTPGEPTGW